MWDDAAGDVFMMKKVTLTWTCSFQKTDNKICHDCTVNNCSFDNSKRWEDIKEMFKPEDAP